MPHDFPPLGRHVLMSGNASERPPSTSTGMTTSSTTIKNSERKPSQLGLFSTTSTTTTTTSTAAEKENGRLGGGVHRSKTTTLPATIPSHHFSSILKHIYDSDAKTFYTVGKFLGKVTRKC